MSTLTRDSTLEEVWAAYDDNSSYEIDESRAKALAFRQACRILARRQPASSSRDGQQITAQSLREEAKEASDWLAANPGTSGAGSTRVRYGDFTYFKE